MTTSTTSLRALCEILENKLNALFAEHLSGMSAREDSRAFGAMVEKRITASWADICASMNVTALDIPGRRSIFDCAFESDGTTYGLDVKTKDLDSKTYSDGGICAVGNLLRFLANERGIFLIVEVGHNKGAAAMDTRDLEYIRVAPFSCLPLDAYRIENLGTGQVRLNYSVNQAFDQIEWDRPQDTFLGIFGDLAISHYERVGKDATKRIDSISAFRDRGYRDFRFER